MQAAAAMLITGHPVHPGVIAGIVLAIAFGIVIIVACVFVYRFGKSPSAYGDEVYPPAGQG